MTTPPRPATVITRAMLQEGGIERMIGNGVPGLVLLTEAERASSLADLLARRPGPTGQGAWVFAYGSLIWNPAINFIERRLARVHGWHRSFCLSTLAGRGSPDLPGLVLGLDRGGTCTGAAFRVAEEEIAVELPILWRREMLSGSYAPRWVAVRDNAGSLFGHAIAFTIRRDGAWYAGGLAPDELLRRLVSARGALGSSADYLFQTRDGLRALGIADRRIELLAQQVERAAQLASAQSAKTRAEP